MSADNAIFVWEAGGTWYAEHGFMSPADEEPNYFWDLAHHAQETYSNRAEAILAGHDKAKDEPVLEYGVVEL